MKLTAIFARCTLTCILAVLFGGIIVAQQGQEKQHEKITLNLKIKNRPNAPYTVEARKAGVEGQVRLRVMFKSNGEIGGIVDVTPDVDRKRMEQFGLTQQAVSAAKRMKFEPAKSGDKPITVVKLVVYGFSLY